MHGRTTSNRYFADFFVSIFVLLLLLWFTYVFLIKVPYAGIYFNPTNGQIVDIYVQTNPTDLLRPGDIIERVEKISWGIYKSDATQSFFEGIQEGQKVSITVRRLGQSREVAWLFPGFSIAELRARFLNIWLLGYWFWFFGFITQLLIRPRSSLRRLLITANYLTAIWLVCGTVSGSHVGGSLVIVRAVTWLMTPVYLNLHWNFPKPLGHVPNSVWAILYSIGCALALVEIFQLLPVSFYSLGFLLALLGGLILLLAHFVQQPTQRRDVGLLLLAILIALLPSIGLGILYAINAVPGIGSLTLLFLPIMPAAYFFVIYRRKLGGLELRANRIISIYSYLILLGTVLLFLTIPAISWSAVTPAWLLSHLVSGLIIAFISILLFPGYQSFIDQRILGITLPYQDLPETYSERITTSLTGEGLLKLLETEVFPSLLVRQFAFLRVAKNHVTILLTRAVPEGQVPDYASLRALLGQDGNRLPSLFNTEVSFSWIKLILPLSIDGNLIGAWLFGQRDPDDLYSQAEVPVLQSLANQTAVALSNIHHTDALRMLYKENIGRHEQERMRLALELHDGVLNKMALLSLNLDPVTASPKFKDAYDGLTQQLRAIVSNLRPPMLQYGLKAALEDLVYDLEQRSNERVEVVVEGGLSEERYPEEIELHIYRILQEASENALKHAKPMTLRLTIRLEPNRIELSIEDDGVGFDLGEELELEQLLADKHFGLAGIVERCRLIGAEMDLRSLPMRGTKLSITWNAGMPSRLI